jgi:hypothetical protein
VVQGELVARQRDAREQQVLVEQEIRDRRPREHVGLLERLDHARALEQEEELRRKGVARHVLIEARDERIFRRLLEQQLRRKPRRKAPREARLAGADRPFHHQVAKLIHGRRSTPRP